MQHMVERHEFLRRMCASARLGAQRIHPADHALVEIVVLAHRVVHARAGFEESRQDVVEVADREGVIGAVVAPQAFGSGAPPVPELARRVALPCEHDEFALRPARDQHRDRFRFAKAREVVKIAVLAEVVEHVVVARALGGRGQDRNRIAPHQPHQLAATAGEFLAHGAAEAHFNVAKPRAAAPAGAWRRVPRTPPGRRPGRTPPVRRALARWPRCLHLHRCLRA